MVQEIPTNISSFTAILFGFISFISPCVLPLMPGYISFICERSLEALLTDKQEEKKKVNLLILFNALAFVVGFSIVFICLGATATIVGEFLARNFLLFSKIAGIFIIIFGLHYSGILPIRLLYLEKRFHFESKPAGILGSIFIGMAFAFGWTPCIGPILGSILLIASQEGSVAQGVFLLALYSFGLAIPFLITAVAIDRFFHFFGKIKKYFKTIEIIAGFLLITIGLLMVTNKFTIFSSFISRMIPWKI